MTGYKVLIVLVDDDQVIDMIQLQKKLLKSHDMLGQLFLLDAADKNIGLISSETICAILVTIIQKRWDRAAGGTEKDSKDDQ